MLVAISHPIVAGLVDVVDNDRDHAAGNVVYRWNATHRVGTRTRHDGPRPTMAAIRAALAGPGRPVNPRPPGRALRFPKGGGHA